MTLVLLFPQTKKNTDSLYKSIYVWRSEFQASNILLQFCSK